MDYKKAKYNLITAIGINQYKVFMTKQRNEQILSLITLAASKIERSLNALTGSKVDKNESSEQRIKSRHDFICDVFTIICEYYIPESVKIAANQYNISKEMSVENYTQLLYFCNDFIKDLELNRINMINTKLKKIYLIMEEQ